MAGTLNVPSPAILKKAGQGEVAELATLMAATAPGQSVHGARRRIKQLRSLLRLLRPRLDVAAYNAVNDALREAARALAGHRRAEALVAAAGKLEAKEGHGAVWRGFAEANRAAHAADGDPATALAIAREAISRAAAPLEAAVVLSATDKTITEEFLAIYGKARKLLRKGLKSQDPQALHEARKFVIHHLHQLRLLQPGNERRLAQLERLREALGDLNDLDELEQLAASTEVSAKGARRMRKARERLLSRVDRETSRLFRLESKPFGKRLCHAAGPHSHRSHGALQVTE